MGHGYDGCQEELYHQLVSPALERGFNVITYEGPGQASLRHFQQKGFILEWETVVTPVVDYLHTLPFVDKNAIGLIGFDFGAFLAARAAAFERRLNALILIDGVFDFSKTFNWGPLQTYLDTNNSTAFNFGIQYILKTTNNTLTKSGLQQGLRAWNLSPFNFAKDVQRFSLENVTEKIKLPTFIGDAENDLFFQGQPKVLADALGDIATMVLFKTEDGEGEQCQVGAFRRLSGVVLDWWVGSVLDK